MTRDSHARPTAAELDILNVLWDRGPSTVREVQDDLPPDRRRGYTTILKLLQIMHEKGTVVRDASTRPQVYEAAAPEGEMQRRLVDDLLGRAFGGSARKLVAALVANDIPDEELEQIRRLLDEA